MAKEKINLGSVIEQKMNERGLTKTKFAELIYRSRQTVDSILKDGTVDIELLCRISDVLDFDFILEYYLKHYYPDENLPPQERKYKVIIEVSERDLPDFIIEKMFPNASNNRQTTNSVKKTARVSKSPAFFS